VTTSPKTPSWRSENVTILTQNPWFAVLLQNVRLPDGSTTEYYTLDFAGPAVGVVARRGGRYLLIRQYRFIVDEHVWAIPSGSVQPGEDPAEAAARELLEETGYRASVVRPLLTYYPSYGCSNQRFILFVADQVEEEPEAFDRNEVIDVRWFERDVLLRMLFDNSIVDGLSLVPLALLLLREELGR
jgi:ADP-ribose pyrophosphatase